MYLKSKGKMKHVFQTYFRTQKSMAAPSLGKLDASWQKLLYGYSFPGGTCSLLYLIPLHVFF